MPTLSGRVMYDQTRQRVQTSGIPSVPVCLYDDATNTGVVVLTGASGMYVVNNVPLGTYSVIECYGTPGVMTPVDFATATAMAKPDPADPPISAVTSPIAGANKLDSLTPNTLSVTVSSGSIGSLHFYDGPIEERPLALFAGAQVGPNLIANANKGNWGDLQDGTIVNTIAPTNEYPGMLTGLAYNAAFPPGGGNVCYDNVPDGFNEWWYVADHTTGMETGRMIVVDSANPEAAFFQENVALAANTHYALTLWIANMNNPAATPPTSLPRIGITLVDSGGAVLFQEILQEISQTNPPQWTQIGALFYNTSATGATIYISAEGLDSAGVGFGVDDIVFGAVDIAELTLEKSAYPCPAAIGETVTYTVLVTNTSEFTAENAAFIDDLASNAIFVPESVTIDGSPYTGYDPRAGFPLDDMVSASSHLITYQVMVADDSVNPIPNQAEASYDVLVSQSGDVFRHIKYSNTVHVYVTKCNLRQAGTDVLASIALMEAALAHIMNAEGEKTQRAVALDLSGEDLIRINGSVASMLQSISVLEDILLSKATLINPQVSCSGEIL